MYSDKHVPLEDQEQTASASSQNDTAARKTRRKRPAVEPTYSPTQSVKLKIEMDDLQNEIMANPELPPRMRSGALAVVFAIAQPMKTTGLCSWQSQITIAEISGLSKPYVRKICKMLDACGYVSTLPGRTGRKHTARYRFSGTWSDDAVSDTLKGNPIALLAQNSVKMDVAGKVHVSKHLAKIKGNPISQNSKSKKQAQNQTCTAESATCASSPLKGGERGIEADTAPASLMLNPALTSDIVVLVPEPSAADDEIQSPACEADIPETEREGTRALRLCSACVEVEEPIQTQPTAALSSALYGWPVANAAGGTVIDLAGQAARRPDTKPHQRGNTMAIPKPEPRPVMFARLLRWYPAEFIGKDDTLNYEAFDLALDHGVTMQQLQAEACLQFSEAVDGKEVPQLAEWLVAQCWDERIAA